MLLALFVQKTILSYRVILVPLYNNSGEEKPFFSSRNPYYILLLFLFFHFSLATFRMVLITEKAQGSLISFIIIEISYCPISKYQNQLKHNRNFQEIHEVL